MMMATKTRGAATGATLPELTIRSIVLGGLITLLFTAANVYLGLRLGITFATSIPAAVISMAILKFYADSTIDRKSTRLNSSHGYISYAVFCLKKKKKTERQLKKPL